ncbi:hypothetical protein PoB_004641900 [Plakobranchus ocellatus]|uniref:Uncharacterized protein n=1 Tax=Plakobranchus ocellatus TaxID=259542 RepID=A0AAV4BLX5_9GAST|nr:hypothetical protein PoB_004641900 [Plakobranchus ocellatus]
MSLPRHAGRHDVGEYGVPHYSVTLDPGGSSSTNLYTHVGNCAPYGEPTLEPAVHVSNNTLPLQRSQNEAMQQKSYLCLGPLHSGSDSFSVESGDRSWPALSNISNSSFTGPNCYGDDNVEIIRVRKVRGPPNTTETIKRTHYS